MFKRVLGWFGVGLGVVGVVLSLVLVITGWWVNSVATTQMLRLFAPVEQALEFGDQANAQFSVFIAVTQTRLNMVGDETPVADALAAELADEIAEARRLVVTAEQLLTSVEPILSQFTRTDQLLTRLRDVIATLDSTDALAQQFQEDRTQAIDILNTELDALQARSGELQTAITDTSHDVATLKQRVPRWIDLVSLAFTLIVGWFGIAQYTLIRSSWRLAQSSVVP